MRMTQQQRTRMGKTELDALDNKFLDSSKDRSELKICNQKFVNYYAGSSFAFAGIGVGSGR